MSKKTASHEIYERFVSECDAYVLPSPWEFLDVPADVRRVPEDPTRLLAQLQESFSHKTLVKAKLLKAKGNGPPRLAKGLASPMAPYIAVRDRENDQIVDFITPEGSVVSGLLPVSATLVERHVCIADERRGTVVACLSFGDAVILRACGIPATLTCGLERLALKHAPRFARRFGLGFHSIWDRRAEKAGDATTYVPPEIESLFEREEAEAEARARQPASESAHTPVSAHPQAERCRSGPRDLVFASRSLVSLTGQPHREFAQLHDHLRKLQDHGGLETERLGQWVLSQEDVGHLLFFVEQEDASSIKQFMLTSVNDSRFGIDTTKQLEYAQRRPKNFAEAWKELVAAPRAASSVADIEEKKRNFVEHLSTGVIAPLMQEAMNEPDPQRRNQLAIAANLSQEIHVKSALKLAELMADLDEYGVESSLRDEQMKDILALAEQIGKLTKGADR